MSKTAQRQVALKEWERFKLIFGCIHVARIAHFPVIGIAEAFQLGRVHMGVVAAFCQPLYSLYFSLLYHQRAFFRFLF